MNGRDWILVFIGLTIIIWVAAWFLVNHIRHHFRLQKIRDQEVRERRLAQVPRRRETWPWPPKGKYKPGEWAGPIDALYRFLIQLHPRLPDNPDWRYQIVVQHPKEQA